jgi:DNA-binding CsgD family transcriptional regulator
VLEREAMSAAFPVSALSPRQVEVLTHYAKGMTPTAIGRLIGLSIKTVSSHLTWAQDKLNLDTRAQLLKYAQGMVTEEAEQR